MTEYTVKKGNTSPIILVGSSSMIDTTGWTCNLLVLDDQGVALIDKNVIETNDAGDKFRAYLTPTETNTLPVETYRLVIELTNAALTPPFNVEEQHVLNVDPQMEIGDATGLVQLTVGSNSFETYENLILKLSQTPGLTQAASASRGQLKAALISAYENIGLLTTDFEVLDTTTNEYKTSTSDFTSADISSLSAKALNALTRAQLIEANALLGGNPIEDRRRAGMLSDSVGESAIFMRTSKPLELSVYRDTAIALKGYIVWTKQIGRG